MSCIVVISPLVIASWPAISAAVTAGVASLGFSIVASSARTSVEEHASTSRKVEVPIEDSEILEGAAGEQIVVERQGMRAVFSRDARGALKLCMEGSAYSDAELKKMGEELINRVTQQYVYHRVVTELKQRNMTIVDEQVSADRTVKIRVRNV
ncbi:MAG TPA: DUF1257 domain-containing protein [Tepidisphaeraceae bacterium]|jgi:hypothetical protein